MSRAAASGLFSIDVPSEICKLAEAQVDHPWQTPAELVRLAFRRGARSVEVTLDRRHAHVRGEGAALGAETLRDLAVVLDASAAPPARHAALVRLEAREALCLVTAAAHTRRRLRVAGDGVALTYEPGGRVRLEPAREAVTVAVEGPDWDAPRARAWLADVTRFASGGVLVNGRSLAVGFEDALVEAALPPPFAGRVALPRRGEAARVFLLRGGVVSAHLSFPERPPFQAALELDAPPHRGAAGLRESVDPALATVCAAAVELAIAASAEAGLGPADEARRRRFLLAACRDGQARARILPLPLLPALHAGSSLHLSLHELAEARADPCPALYPGQNAAAFALPDSPVLVLDAQERALVQEIVSVRFLAPPHSTIGRSRWARLLRTLSRTGRRGWAGTGPAAAETSLAGHERALLLVLRKLAPAERFALTDGRGEPRRRDGRWLLPRRHPLVRACAHAAGRHEAWAYPALLALLDGAIDPPGGAREAWAARSATPPRG